MASDYSRIMYKQYMEVMEWLEKMEAAHKQDCAAAAELSTGIIKCITGLQKATQR